MLRVTTLIINAAWALITITFFIISLVFVPDIIGRENAEPEDFWLLIFIMMVTGLMSISSLYNYISVYNRNYAFLAHVNITVLIVILACTALEFFYKSADSFIWAACLAPYAITYFFYFYRKK